ncbi:MAG: AraC family transcriptional regulator [Gemmiger sp.]|nr:AraC family transcriptional regulator [Gemmiger sp.]
MAHRAKTIVEYRNYDLPVHFPILMISGDNWRISDVPSGVHHFHNCLEIGLCESDSGTLGFQDQSFPFQAGDVTVITSDMPHTTYSTPGTASKWAYLFVDPEELLRPFFPLDTLPRAELFRQLLHSYRAVLPRAENPVLYATLCQILQEMQGRKLNYEVSVRGLFLALMTELMRIHAAAAPAAAQTAIPIAPALRYITEHYMDSFTMEELADACHMSPSHFRRVFGEIMGIGPLEHLNRTRILKACTLLRMTEDSILRISEQVGFRSLSSFNRHFAAAMGESPTDWRKRMSANQHVTILKYSGWLVPPAT